MYNMLLLLTLIQFFFEIMLYMKKITASLLIALSFFSYFFSLIWILIFALCVEPPFLYILYFKKKMFKNKLSLFVSMKEAKVAESTSNLDNCLHVIFYNNIFNVWKKLHCKYIYVESFSAAFEERKKRNKSNVIQLCTQKKE